MATDDASGEIAFGEITGGLLAGGRSSRMGREKGLVQIGGKPMVEHVIARLRPQVHRIVISANDNPACFSGTCLPVVADAVEGHAGPLAGLHAALQWAASETPDARFLATVPIDTPFLPSDLVMRLAAHVRAGNATSAIAASGGMRHPVVGLWSVTLLSAVEDALGSGVRAMTRFAEMQKSAVVDFPFVEIAGACVDPFFNVNTPADVETAQALLAALSAAEPLRG
jgi:molybdenum cofactor guanylyltransferase